MEKYSNINISIIVPIYQNELNIHDCYNELSNVFKNSDIEYEIIFIDDGSTDNSYLYLSHLVKTDPRLSLIKLSRNFGQVSAIICGLEHSKGHCSVNISADLQDPPAIILEMYRVWQEGEHKLVIGEREKRNDSLWANTASKIFYRLFQKFALSSMPHGGFDFFLIDKSMVEIITEINEKNVFLQGLLLWPGFKPFFIKYERKKREKGKSQWNISRKINYFIDGFVSYSFFPLRLISLFGIFFFLLAIVFAIGLIFQRLLWGTNLPGWTSLVILLLFLNSVQFIFLGILGEYLWRSIEQNRKRPLYIIESIKRQK